MSKVTPLARSGIVGSRSFPRLMAVIGLIGIASFGVLVGLRPDLGLLLLVVPLALTAICLAYWAPGLVFAAYLLIPFYKGAVQPYLPVDLTVILALLNTLQIIPIVFKLNVPQHEKAQPLLRWHALLLWLALASVIVLGLLYTPDASIGDKKAIFFLGLVFLPTLAVFRIATEVRFVRQLIWTVFAMGAIITVVGVSNLLTGTEQLAEPGTSTRLTLLGTNTIGVSRAALFVVLIGLIYPGIRYMRNLALRTMCLLLIPSALVVSLGTGSRGPLIAMIGTIGFLGLRNSARILIRDRRLSPKALANSAAALMTGIIILLGILLASSAMPKSIDNLIPSEALFRFQLFYEFVENPSLGTSIGPRPVSLTPGEEGVADYDSLVSRLWAADYAIDMLSSNPVFGQGTGSFEYNMTYLHRLQMVYPHNILLEFAAENGLLGLTMISTLLAVAVSRGLRLSASPEWNQVLILFIFVVLNESVSGSIVESRMFWGLLVLLLAAPPVEKVAPAETLHAQLANRG